MRKQFLVGKEVIKADGRIILNWMLGKQTMRTETGFIRPEILLSEKHW
jgi:hypothetical protein